MQLHYQNVIVSTRRGDLIYTLQNTPVEKENPGQHEGAYDWCNVIDNVSNWTYLRQTPEYFDWHNTSAYAIGRIETLLTLMDRGYYHDELKDYGITKKTPETNRMYYRYFEAQDIPSHTAPHGPNFLNFILQMFQHDTMLLFIVVVSLLMADQVYHDHNSDTYKAIYSQPTSRKRLIIAKVSAAVAVVLLTLPATLAIFSVVPLSAHGVENSVYPHIVYTCDIVSWTWLLQRILPFFLLVILFYMTVAALLASWQETVSNTVLCIDPLLVLVYFLVRIFGYSTPLLSRIPLFYIYSMEIAAYDFTLDLLPCTILCIVDSPAFLPLHVFIIEERDLEGGVRP